MLTCYNSFRLIDSVIQVVKGKGCLPSSCSSYTVFSFLTPESSSSSEPRKILDKPKIEGHIPNLIQGSHKTYRTHSETSRALSVKSEKHEDIH